LNLNLNSFVRVKLKMVVVLKYKNKMFEGFMWIYSLVVLVLAAALEQTGRQHGHQFAADVVVEPAVDNGVADGRAHRNQVTHGRGDVNALGRKQQRLRVHDHPQHVVRQPAHGE
jgi:hypothetical protein